MKQLLYTSCRPGQSLSGSSGFQVRAVSAGLTSDQIRTAAAYASYALPAGAVPGSGTLASAPVRLAFMEIEHLGRVVCHSVYVGKDPVTQRWGNFFSHMLLQLPEHLNALVILRSWESSFWRREDGEFGTLLDDVKSLPTNTQASPEMLRKFVRQPGHRELLKFLLSALVLRNEPRIIVAADPEAVVGSLQVLSMCLPTRFFQELTFSTYEADPLTSPVRICATTWANSEMTCDLPSSSYTDGCVAYNTYSSRRSEIETSAFATKVVDSLESADGIEWLVRFQQTCDKIGLTMASLQETMFRFLYLERKLSPDAIGDLCRSAGALTWLLGNAKTFKAVVTSAATACTREPTLADAFCRPFGKIMLSSSDVKTNIASLDNSLKKWCLAWCDITQVYEAESFDMEHATLLSRSLWSVSSGMATDVIRTYLSRMVDHLVSHDGAATSDIVTLARSLGKYADGGEVAIFRLTIDDIRMRYPRALARVNVGACVAAAMCDPHLRLSMSKDETRRMITSMRKQGGRALIGSIDRLTTGWPKKHKEHWRQLTWWYRWKPLFFAIAIALVVVAAIVAAILPGPKSWIWRFIKGND